MSSSSTLHKEKGKPSSANEQEKRAWVIGVGVWGGRVPWVTPVTPDRSVRTHYQRLSVSCQPIESPRQKRSEEGAEHEALATGPSISQRRRSKEQQRRVSRREHQIARFAKRSKESDPGTRLWPTHS